MKRSSNRAPASQSQGCRTGDAGRQEACRPEDLRPRKGPQTARAPSVSGLVDRLKELRAQLRITFVVAAPKGSQGARVAFANAAHLGAEVRRVEVHSNAMRLEDAHQLVRDLHPDALLDGEPSREHANQPRQLGDPDDLLMGDVGDVSVAMKRKRVVLAEGE